MAGTSYTRQSTIADGNLISASLFNSEYNQIVNAFAYTTTGTTGHTHDGSAGQGGAIAKIGDQDFKNKIVVSATDNRIEFYSEVGGSPVEQVRIQDGAIVPVTDSDVDLGTTSVRFKDAFVDSVTVTNNIVVAGTVDGRDVAADGTKLDGIEASATADQTDAEIRAAVEAATDSNVFTDADHTKLNSIEVSATADQTDAEIRAAVEAATDSNVFTDADHTKLNAIEASADVTDTTNVTAAGALMDSEVTNLAQVKAFDSSDYATAAQGTKADAALPTTGGAMTGAITTNSTFDGRDVATDGTKLDGIEAGADVTDTTNVVASLTAGSNITIAADGTIASTASGGGNETLAQTLVLGNTTGGTDLSVSSGDNIVMAASSTVDGRDVSVDGTKLDGIEAGADVTDTTNVVASLSAGTGISLSAGGEIANTAPDQTVALTGGTGISTSGTYPNFTITNDSPDQIVALTGGGGTTVTGTYPSFTITSTGGSGGNETLAQTLVLGNTTGGTDISVSSGDNILMAANSTVDGRDVSVDGTKLDGIEAGATGDQTAAEILTAIKTVDGSGSGLDADLLDGQEGAFYYPASNPNGYTSNVGDITAVVAGNGLSGGGVSGDVTVDVGAGDGIDVAVNTVAVDSTVIRTTGNQAIAGIKNFSDEIRANGGLGMGDNDKITFGSGDDLEIYHDGSNSYIADVGTGNLRIQGDNVQITNADGTQNKMFLVSNGGVSLYNANQLKLQTNVLGVAVTGEITADGLSLGDNDKALFGTGDDLEIYHNGSNSYITDTGTGNLFVGGSSYVDIGNGVTGIGGQTYARFNVSGACQLNYNGVDKLKTISTGANITGSLGIGTTSPSEELHVVGDIIATGNITAFFSDERLKDFQGTIPDALDKVNSLNGYYFTPNDTALGLGVEDKGVEVGISAQEVEAVLPEIVTDSAVGEGYKTVWYEKLTPLLIEAVKELTGKVDNLEARLKELEK